MWHVTLIGREKKHSLNRLGSSRSNASFLHFIIFSFKLDSLSSRAFIKNTDFNENIYILSYSELSAESRIIHSDDENCQCDMSHWQVEKQKTLEIERDQETPMYHPGTVLYYQQRARPARAIRFFRKVDFSQIWLMMYGTYVLNRKLN